MNNDRLKIIINIKEFILKFENYLINYPKKYYELRNRIVYDTYQLLELAYEANYSKQNQRGNIQLKMMVKINMLDFYIEESFNKKIISEKQCCDISNKLLVINKMLHKWYKDNEC